MSEASVVAFGRRRYSDKEKAEFRTRFIRKQRYQVACLVPLAGAVALVVVGSPFVPDIGVDAVITIALGAVVLVLSGVGCSWLVWRCPACGRYLGRNLSPKQCPHCRVPLAAR